MTKRAAAEQAGTTPEKQAKTAINIDSINFEEAANALSNLKPASRLVNNRTAIVRRLLPEIEEAKKRGVSVESIAKALTEQTNVTFSTNTLRGILANLNRKSKPRTEK